MTFTVHYTAYKGSLHAHGSVSGSSIHEALSEVARWVKVDFGVDSPDLLTITLLSEVPNADDLPSPAPTL